MRGLKEKKKYIMMTAVLMVVILSAGCANSDRINDTEEHNKVTEEEEKNIEKENEDPEDPENPVKEKEKTEDFVKEKEEEEAPAFSGEYIQSETLSSEKTEEEVLRIRGIYNNIQANISDYETLETDNGGVCYRALDGSGYEKVVFKSGTEGNTWSREYFYENKKLIFAFYFQGKTEHRLYLYNNSLFRWIDADRNIYDGIDAADENLWRAWEAELMPYLNNPQ